MNSVRSGPAVWSTALQICSYDVDMTRRARLPCLCRYFLEAAWNHAEALGVGFSHLAAQDRVWVLARLLMRVNRPPDWGERISLRTWPRGIRTLFAMRDFEFLDSTGRTLAAGTSGWLVLNLKTRRPQKLDFLPGSIHAEPGRQVLEREPGKLLAVTAQTSSMPVTARISDIDVNAHVNSARYIDWMLDSYPRDFFQRHVPELLEVNYLGETRAGDALEVRSSETSTGQWSHSIWKPGGAEVCRGTLGWARLRETS